MATNGSRRRAVRLTDKGLAIIQEALQKEAAGRKLTREDRARILDVSVVTAHRIVTGRGVDRTSLLIAFKKLNLEWRECFCEYARPEQEVQHAIVSPTPTKSQAGKPNHFWVAVAAVTIACITLFAWNRGDKVPAALLQEKTHDQLAQDLVDQATNEYNVGQYEAARQHVREAASRARILKNAPILANAEVIDGHIALVRGDYSWADHCYTEALQLRQALHQRVNVPPLLMSIGNVEAAKGELAQAKSHLLQSLREFKDLNDEPGIVLVCRDLGSVAAQSGQRAEAHRWFSEALQKVKAMDKPELVADIQARRSELLRDEHRFTEARAILDEVYRFWLKRRHARWIAKTLFQRGALETVAGNHREAESLFLKSEALYQQVGDKPGVGNCQTWLAKARTRRPARRLVLSVEKGGQTPKTYGFPP